MGRRRQRGLGRRLLDRAEAAALLALGLTIRAFGAPFGYFLAERIGDLLPSLLPSRRRIALRNLEIAFGDELDDAARRRLVRASCRNALSVIVDLLVRDRLLGERPGEDPGQRAHRHDRYFAMDEDLLTLLAGDRPHGALVISAHHGSWEMGQYLPGLLGHAVAPVVRPLDNPHLDRHVARLRTTFGNPLIPKRGALRGMMLELRKGGAVAVMPDQNASKSDDFVDFLGTPAATHTGFADLIVRLGCGAAVAVCLRRGRGFSFEYRCRPLSPPPDLPPAEKREWILREFTTFLDEQVRAHPEQYLWLHRRWKKRPPGEESLYRELNRPLSSLTPPSLGAPRG